MMFKSKIVLWTLPVLVALSQSAAAPIITSFTPTVGAPGDQIELNGSGFSGGNFTVRFFNGGSGAVVTSGFVNSDTLLTVTVPSGIITGPISIQQGTGDELFTPDDFIAIGTGPYIIDFSPLYGSVNDTVAINGVHLLNVTAVKFAGANASQFTPNAAGTQITTRVPAGATNGLISVTTGLGTSNSPAAFTVVGQGPFVTGFSPIAGNSSTKVQINGLHFTGVTNVTFNGRRGVGLTANSDTLIQIQPPVGVTSGPIGVYTTKGSFITTSNFFGIPVITGFSPGSGRVGTNVVINGTNFLGATAVYFGSVISPSVTPQSNLKITAAVPAGAINGPIRVVVPAGSAFSTNNFVVMPTISGFSPAFGPAGTPVTITGANLNAKPVVRFNGVLAAAPTGVSFSQLIVQAPPGASNGPITLTTTNGSAASATAFSYPAKVSGFSSSNSPAGSVITITGENFVGTEAVSFNGGLAPSFTVSNNSIITAVVPAGAITGPISVITPAGAATSPGVFYGKPVITGFTPVSGVPGDSVTVNGTSFTGTVLQFADKAANVISLNNTQMVAVVPAGASTGPLMVTGPGGATSSASNFFVDYKSNLRVGITNSANAVTVGSNLVYTLFLYNAGPTAAPNTTFTNVLPDSAVLVAVSPNPPWTFSTNGNVLVGTTTNFGNGNSTAFSVTVRPQSPGNIMATVTAGSDHTDPFPSDNSASIITTVNPLPLLSIEALADALNISWPVVYSNYALQFRDTLGPAAQWTAVTNPPVTIGDSQVVTEINNGTGRVYRLRK